MPRVIPKKRFGQHFLRDARVLSRIMQTIAPQKDQAIIEIGPGTGALTEYLLAAVPSITAIELDRELVRTLRKRHACNLHLIHGDALKVDFTALAKRLAGGGKVQIVGNLPYNISTPLIFHFLNSLDGIGKMTFMVQREVALRICANPGDRHYGRVSVMTSAYLHRSLEFDVGAECFSPPPRVCSSVIVLTPLASPVPIGNRGDFEELVKRAFSLRRKTLRNALQGWAQDSLFRLAEIDPARRPQTLSCAEFARLLAAKKRPQIC